MSWYISKKTAWPVAQWSVHSRRLLQDLGALTDFSFVGSKKPLRRKPGASLLSLAAVSLIVCLAHGFFLILEIGWMPVFGDTSCWLLVFDGWILVFGSVMEMETSQEGYANKRWNPISTNPSLSNHYHILFSPVLDRFDSPPQSRTPKKNKSG